MHVILHPGFHKTGTSSLQRGLAAHDSIMAPRLRYVLMTEMPEVIRAARKYSRKPKPMNLVAFGEAFDACLEALEDDTSRPLLITSEDLSGLIPGKFGVETYAASSALMDRAVDRVLARFGPETKIDIWYTTRAPEAWLRSVYYQLLRGTRLTEDFAKFQMNWANAARLEDVVAETARLVEHKATVDAGRLEVCANTALGPLGMFLDRYRISTQGLPPLPVENVQPHGVAEELLAINRSKMSDKVATEAKRRILNKYRSAGATTQAAGGSA
ncbi:hypothetical protein [Roseovarius rhodophyticola]|uniref:Sulfotransferase family protein n=1 Tax=Roseovarius rhodophyticola TaxID=3080827 RepID=A0ABZ2TJ06_9RHOB|nr:hypothetical protein [Roseovarius sp. W115]MDV2929601.1 hypothetical protein [Roseovarius sp. W115]